VRRPFDKTCRRAQVESLRACSDLGIPDAKETMVARMLFVSQLTLSWTEKLFIISELTYTKLGRT